MIELTWKIYRVTRKQLNIEKETIEGFEMLPRTADLNEQKYNLLDDVEYERQGRRRESQVDSIRLASA